METSPSGGAGPLRRLVLVDKENVGLSLTRSETLWAILDHMDATLAADEVWVVGAHGFGADQQQWLRGLGVKVQFLQYIETRTDGLKNGADIALAVLAVDEWHGGRFGEVGLAAGDFDFRPLLAYLHDRDCVVTLLHSRPAVPPLLSDVADRVIPLAEFDADYLGQKRMTQIVPRRPWRQVRLPWNSILPGSTGALVEALEEIVQVIEQGGLTHAQFETILTSRGVSHGVLGAALGVHDSISPRGALLHGQTGTNRLDRTRRLDSDSWIDEAYLVWLGSALAAVVAKSKNRDFRTAAFTQAREYVGDDVGIGTAWGRVQDHTCPPAFVTAAAKAGVQVPSDAWVRHDVLRHLHDQEFPTGVDLPNVSIRDALKGAPARLNGAERSALRRALSASPAMPGVEFERWMATVDGNWIRQVVRCLKSHLPCNARRLRAHYFYDIPSGLDSEAAIKIATA